jgi:hypothetical protein
MIRLFQKPWEVTVSKGDEVIAAITSQNAKSSVEVQNFLDSLIKKNTYSLAIHLFSEGQIHILLVDKHNNVCDDAIKVQLRRK